MRRVAVLTGDSKSRDEWRRCGLDQPTMKSSTGFHLGVILEATLIERLAFRVCIQR